MFIISVTPQHNLAISFKIMKCLVYMETMGVYINPFKLNLRLDPTVIGVQSIKLGPQWAKSDFKHGNCVGFGFIKFMWYL